MNCAKIWQKLLLQQQKKDFTVILTNIIGQSRIWNILTKKSFSDNKKNKTFPEIWVSSTYTRYRAAFKKYLKEFFAIDNIPFNFHVDHMQSKVFFKNKYPEYFIRLFLLDKKINCYYGCKYEKLQASYEKNRKPHGGYHMSFIQIAKIYGFSLPDLHHL